MSSNILVNIGRYALTRAANHGAIRKCMFSTSSLRLSDRLYSEKHEWVKVNGKVGTVGVSKYAQESLGDVVYVLLPELETELNQHDEAGTIESVKAASEIYTPVSGKVVEVNSKLETKPGLVNSSYYEDGWIFKIELSDEGELKTLMNEEQYTQYLKKVTE